MIEELKYLQSSNKETILKEISEIINEFDLYNYENNGYYLLRDRYNQYKQPFNLELVKAERALRTFERYYTSGCEVLVEELKEVLRG